MPSVRTSPVARFAYNPSTLKTGAEISQVLLQSEQHSNNLSQKSIITKNQSKSKKSIKNKNQLSISFN